MWYPGKFWRNIAYSTFDGELRAELDHWGPSWKHRRRFRMATRRNDEFPVFVPHRSERVVVEGWSDTVDHRFNSVILRCDLGDDGRCWIETRTGPGGVTFSLGDRTLPARSGPFVIATSTQADRTVSVVQPEGGTIEPDDLELVPLNAALAPT